MKAALGAFGIRKLSQTSLQTSVQQLYVCDWKESYCMVWYLK